MGNVLVVTYFTFIPTTRLGNWLFQYAAAIARGGDVVGYMPDQTMLEQLKPHWDIFGRLKIISELPEGVPVCREGDKSGMPLMDAEVDLCIDGYFQDEKYFARAADEVRRRFAPTPEMVSKLRSRYGDWLSRPNITGLSVRRGDYLQFPHRYPIMNRGYYARCMRELHDCSDFIVCSDDIGWCRAHFPKWFPDKRFCFSTNATALDDLYLLSLCQNNIISNSSFHWWGAWLNTNPRKRVLMPKLWFGPEYRNRYNLGMGPQANGWLLVENHQLPVEWLRGQALAKLQLLKRCASPIKEFIAAYLRGGLS